MHILQQYDPETNLTCTELNTNDKRKKRIQKIVRNEKNIIFYKFHLYNNLTKRISGVRYIMKESLDDRYMVSERRSGGTIECYIQWK